MPGPDGADTRALGYRTAFLQIMVSHSLEFGIAPWIKDGQPDEPLRRVIADIPMEWMEIGVTRQGPPFDLAELMRRLEGLSREQAET